MRRLVLEAAAALGQPVSVRPVALRELPGTREAFITNVRWGLQSVQLPDGRALSGDDHARRLRAVIDADRT